MISVNEKRFSDNFFALAKIGWTDTGLNRPSYSPAYLEGRELVKKLMEDAGMAVRIDSVGNIFGRYEGTDPARGTVITGSHLDSVPNGGVYDGALGVVAGIEAARSVHEQLGSLPAALEVVGFVAEEASPLGGTFGSRAITGLAPLDQPPAAFEWSGLNREALERARVNTKDYEAYLELHIEQGPVLERKNIDIGIPTGIVSIIRYKVTMTGQQNHAGTTPMGERLNAVRGLSEFIAAWCAWADGRLAQSDDFVYNTGVIAADPNSPAVVPGKASVVVELRSLTDAIDAELVARLHELVKDPAFAAYSPAIEKVVSKAPVALQERAISAVEQAAGLCGLSCQRMPSGASHDAVAMAHFMDTGMIFVKSRDGISHNKAEHTAEEDMHKGLRTLAEALTILAR